MAAGQKTWLGSTDGDWGTAGNWNDSEAPEASDEPTVPADATVNIDGSDDDTVALNSVTVELGCSITIGSTGTPLEIDLADDKTFFFGGTGVAYIDCSGANAAYYIRNASPGAGTNSPGLYLTGGEATSNVYVNCENSTAHVGLCVREGDSGTFTNIYLSKGRLTIGPDCTSSVLKITGGEAWLWASIATVEVSGDGKLHLMGSSAQSTSLTVRENGKLYDHSTGTKAAVHVYAPGQIDRSATSAGVTYTACDLYGNAESADLILDPNDTIGDIAFSFNGCGLKALNKGVGLNATTAALA